MPLISRVGDNGTGVCPGHPIPVPFISTVMVGAGSVFVQGQLAAISTSISTCTCGHTAFVLSVSGIVFAQGGGVHRLGDTGSTTPGGIYTMISSCSSVLAS